MIFLRYFLFTLIGLGIVGMLLFLFLFVLSAIWLSKSKDFARIIVFRKGPNELQFPVKKTMTGDENE